MNFKDQVVWVTGSTRGIGKNIATAFAKAGATVIITGRSEEAAKKAGDELHSQGLNSVGMGCDVTNMQSVHETVNKILDKHNRIDILVNNAGITKDNLLLRMSESDWDDVINTNLRGVFNCTKVVAKAMLKQASAKGKQGSPPKADQPAADASGGRKGKIINIASIIGITGNAGQANYAASKAGIIGFTKSLAKELASRAITVNAIAPGYITTDMTNKLNDQARETLLKNIPLGRLGQPSDVSGVCLFLASSDADYITGQTIVVDGGLAI